MGMAFVDECVLYVRSGRGGDGSASMRSEPYKARGGPDGGNGGEPSVTAHETSCGTGLQGRIRHGRRPGAAETAPVRQTRTVKRFMTNVTDITSQRAEGQDQTREFPMAHGPGHTNPPRDLGVVVGTNRT